MDLIPSWLAYSPDCKEEGRFTERFVSGLFASAISAEGNINDSGIPYTNFKNLVLSKISSFLQKLLKHVATFRGMCGEHHLSDIQIASGIGAQHMWGKEVPSSAAVVSSSNFREDAPIARA